MPPSGGPDSVKGSPGYGAASSSRQAAVSRSDRVSTWCTAQPSSGSPAAGAQVTRPREVFRPTTPQADAGILIEPPPSEPVAIGTIPAPTAAPDPPLEPPAMWSPLQGVLVGPQATVSVVPITPNSEVVARPTGTMPQARTRRTSSDCTCATHPSASRLPASVGRPASPWNRSFSSTGTPWNGPGSAASADSTASSYSPAIAPRRGSVRSAPRTARWASSAGVTCPSRTSSASARASCAAYSSSRIDACLVQTFRSPRRGR